MPFRDAHGVIGELVLYCIDHGKAMDDLSLSEWKAICPMFEQDIYDAISMETCINKRVTVGAPGRQAMAQEIASYKKYLQEQTCFFVYTVLLYLTGAHLFVTDGHALGKKKRKKKMVRRT